MDGQACLLSGRWPNLLAAVGTWSLGSDNHTSAYALRDHEADPNACRIQESYRHMLNTKIGVLSNGLLNTWNLSWHGSTAVSPGPCRSDRPRQKPGKRRGLGPYTLSMQNTYRYARKYIPPRSLAVKAANVHGILFPNAPTPLGVTAYMFIPGCGVAHAGSRAQVLENRRGAQFHCTLRPDTGINPRTQVQSGRKSGRRRRL